MLWKINATLEGVFPVGLFSCHCWILFYPEGLRSTAEYLAQNRPYQQSHLCLHRDSCCGLQAIDVLFSCPFCYRSFLVLVFQAPKNALEKWIFPLVFLCTQLSWNSEIQDVFTEFTPNFAWPSRQDHLCLTWMRTAPWISAQVKNSRSEWIAKAFYQLEEPSACTEVIVCGGRARNGCSWTEMLRIIVLLHWDMSVLTHWVLSVSFPPVPSQSVWWHVTSLWKLMPWVSQWLPSAATTPTWERLHILSWLPSAPIWKGLAFERRAR